jgi:hypothetical protein
MMSNGVTLDEKQVNGGTAVFQHSPETKELQKEKEAGCQADEVSSHQYLPPLVLRYYTPTRSTTGLCQPGAPG